MKATTNTNANANNMNAKLIESVDKVRNVFAIGDIWNYVGCTIKITDKREPYTFINGAGNVRTKSARYDGSIKFPDGSVKPFRNLRGGAIARECGVYVIEENDRKKKATANGEIWECARKYYAENR